MTTPTIAFDTIHYAVECAMHENRAMALEIINGEGNGLTEAQKQAISKQLMELSCRPKTVREKNQFENRLVGVLQPATLKFLENPKLLAEVFNFFLSPRNSVKSTLTKIQYRDPVQALSIQLPRKVIDQSIVKRHLRGRVSLYIKDILTLLEMFHEKKAHILFIETQWTKEEVQQLLESSWKKEEIQQLLACAPEFHKLQIQNEFHSGMLKQVAEAISSDGKTNFRKISDRTYGNDVLSYTHSSLRYLSPFLTELDVERAIMSNDLIDLVKTLPSVKRLSIKLESTALGSDDLMVLSKLKLASLNLSISICEDCGFTQEDIEILKTLHLEELDLSRSDGFNDEQLLLLKDFPDLHTLNIDECPNISAKGIAAFAQGNTSIKTIYYELIDNREREMGLTQEEVNQLEREYPHIDFIALNDDWGCRMTIPKIAYDTIHYAVECAMLENRAMALEVINEAGNGLTEGQKQAISKQLLEPAGRPKTVREKNQFENRLVGILQPATLKFLESPKLVAEVVNFSLDPRAFVSSQLVRKTYKNRVQAFSIQFPRSELDQSIIRRHLRDRDNLYLQDIHRFLEIIHGKRPATRFETSWTKEEIAQLLAWAPNFMELIIRDDFNTGFVLKVAEAILEGKTKFRKLYDQTRNTPLSYRYTIELSKLSPLISELDVDRSLLKEELTDLVKVLPSIKILHIELDSDALEEDGLGVLMDLNLSSLILGISIEDVASGFTEDDIAILNTLHLEELNLSGSDGLTNAQLLLLKDLSDLHILNLYDCERITAKGIADFVKGNTSIKTIYYELIDGHKHIVGLTPEEVSKLEATYPHIDFKCLNNDGGVK